MRPNCWVITTLLDDYYDARPDPERARGVYPIVDGQLSMNRRMANISEGAEMARIIERKALELTTAIRIKHAAIEVPKT